VDGSDLENRPVLKSVAPDGHRELSGRRVTQGATCSENQAEAARWPRAVTLPAFTIGTGRIRRFTTLHPEQADQQLAANLRRATAFAVGRRAQRSRPVDHPSASAWQTGLGRIIKNRIGCELVMLADDGLPRNRERPLQRANSAVTGGFADARAILTARTPPNLVVLRLAPIVACSLARGGALTLGPSGPHCMPRRPK